MLVCYTDRITQAHRCNTSHVTKGINNLLGSEILAMQFQSQEACQDIPYTAEEKFPHHSSPLPRNKELVSFLELLE